MLTLYGSARSRASRSLLALEELGLAYDHRPLRHWASSADLEILGPLNPNGRVPVLDDEGLILWESMAINLYLGDRWGGPLWPADVARRGRLYQWTLWSQNEIDVPARQKARFGPDPEASERAAAELLGRLAILDAALSESTYLLGAVFSLADLNVAATLSEPHEGGLIEGNLDPAAHGLPRLAAWLMRCCGRQSWARVAAMP